MKTQHTPRAISPDDVIAEGDRNYDLGRKHAKDELAESVIEPLIAILESIDKLTCNCPCMSLQAQHEFERCKDANEYKVALAGVLLEIRAQARVALTLNIAKAKGAA